MAIRDAMNHPRRRKLIVISMTAVICIAVGAIAYMMRPPPSIMEIPAQAYFSDDNGATFYPDNRRLIPPGEHNGNKTVRAVVFKSKDGAPKVGYLMKYAISAIPAAQAFLDAHPTASSDDACPAAVDEDKLLIKRPLDSDDKWIASSDPRAAKIRNVSVDSGAPILVEPPR